MIVITRRLAKRLKTVFRQALDITTRREWPIVQLAGGPQGLRIRCGNGQAAAEFHLEGEQTDETIFVPFELFGDIEGGRDVPVEIQLHDEKVTVSWRDGSVPQLLQYDQPTVRSEHWPPTPEQFTENPPRLLRALADAGATTDPDSSRYALGCIQLRGDHGKVVATDGRQLLVEDGFEFPWDGDVLLPRSRLFGSKQLPEEESVHVGKADDWLTLRVGPWTFCWRLNKDGRFPTVENHIQNPEVAVASVELPPSDRVFLAENLRQMPGDDTLQSPVTLDLNGTVAVRARGQDAENPMEMVLTGATRHGEPIRMMTDRRYLARAAQLGFERIHIFGDKQPMLAADDHRRYVWAVLDARSCIEPTENMTRIESPVPGRAARVDPPHSSN